ncbi:MAG: redoxin domain-containing protein [Chlorobia bacterium]|nr:redoxin domain-containing protein [Fimbriimonadaceae bacterium]
MKRGFMLICALLLSASIFANGEITIGTKAPELKVAKWFKGKPIKNFEKGKIYVVEFWATWCGPCKATIPHLTELAKKFKGKVEVVGVSVWENKPGDWADETFGKIETFVQEFGDKMNYNVAADGKDGFMAENWMTAANQGGIPSAFVIDRTGEVAWIGHPMSLDKVLHEVVTGTFDKQAAKSTFEAQQVEAKKQSESAVKRAEILKPMNEALKAGNIAEGLAQLDSIAIKNPDMAKSLALTKFNILLKSDEAAAMKHADSAAMTTLKDEPMMLNMLAWPIVDDASKIKKPDYDVAIRIAIRANELTKSENPYILDTLAYAYFKGGQLDKAIEFQEKAVATLDKTQMDDQTKKEITERLAMFKEKKKGG